jgi:prepilin-type N-terminal cleavage/methylation domain-containing protein
MMRRRKAPDEKGFTLVEMIITALVSGILMVVVSRLFLGTFKGWLFNYSALQAQSRSRVYRDTIIKRLRQAQTSTIEISRHNDSQPPRSMLSFTDAAGKNWVFAQKNNTVVMGPWYLNTTTGLRVISPTANVAINSKVERLVFYNPNIKDLSNINFALDLKWTLLSDNKLKPVTIQMVGSAEVRDP